MPFTGIFPALIPGVNNRAGCRWKPEVELQEKNDEVAMPVFSPKLHTGTRRCIHVGVDVLVPYAEIELWICARGCGRSLGGVRAIQEQPGPVKLVGFHGDRDLPPGASPPPRIVETLI